MVELVLTRGLPASGKSTAARAWVADNPGQRARVNRDDLRFNLFGEYVLSFEQEEAVTAAQHAAVRGLLHSGRSVIVDDTNLSAKYVKQWYKVAYETGAEVLFYDVDTDVEECVRRNEKRIADGGRGVDESVIRRFAQRYMSKGKLPDPPKPETVPVPRPYEPNTLKPRAWLVDIDGTLAHMDDRRGPFEWHRVGEDRLDESLARLMRIIRSHEPMDDNHPDVIIVLSGRDGSCRPQTEEWLKRHGISYDHLWMRAAGDMRKDNIIKMELFDQHIRDNFWVQAVFDDRDQVVRMWRSLGVPCYQVAYGDF